jgi:hypothetical protein
MIYYEVKTRFPKFVFKCNLYRYTSERRQRLIQEVTVQYNLCNEPWLKYSIAAVADQVGVARVKSVS